jgi:multiple sugar transport system substrate-binding protein
MSTDDTGIWQRLFDQFHQANPGIRIQFIEGPSATNTREDLYVTSFLSGETTYDLIYADVPWIPKFAAAGWLEDLTDRWPAESWERFIPGAIIGGSYRSRIYRAPTQLNGGMLFYRKDLLESAGLQPPETFTELVKISQQLQNPGELWGYVWQGKQYEGLSCVFLEVLAGFGGFWIDEERVGLEQAEAVAAVKFLRDCIHSLGISPAGVTTYTEEESRNLFHAGKAVFHRNWPYVWPLSQKEDSPVRDKVGIIPVPHAANGKSASTLGGWGFCIAKSSRNKEAAWKFIEYITALPQIRQLHEATGMEPALRQYYEESNQPEDQAIYEVMLKTIPRPPIPQYAQASDILQRYVSAALTNQMTPEQAMEAAARETRLLLRRESASEKGAVQ